MKLICLVIVPAVLAVAACGGRDDDGQQRSPAEEPPASTTSSSRTSTATGELLDNDAACDEMLEIITDPLDDEGHAAAFIRLADRTSDPALADEFREVARLYATHVEEIPFPSLCE